MRVRLTPRLVVTVPPLDDREPAYELLRATIRHHYLRRARQFSRRDRRRVA